MQQLPSQSESSQQQQLRDNFQQLSLQSTPIAQEISRSSDTTQSQLKQARTSLLQLRDIPKDSNQQNSNQQISSAQQSHPMSMPSQQQQQFIPQPQLPNFQTTSSMPQPSLPYGYNQQLPSYNYFPTIQQPQQQFNSLQAQITAQTSMPQFSQPFQNGQQFPGYSNYMPYPYPWQPPYYPYYPPLQFNNAQSQVDNKNQQQALPTPKLSIEPSTINPYYVQSFPNINIQCKTFDENTNFVTQKKEISNYFYIYNIQDERQQIAIGFTFLNNNIKSQTSIQDFNTFESFCTHLSQFTKSKSELLQKLLLSQKRQEQSLYQYALYLKEQISQYTIEKETLLSIFFSKLPDNIQSELRLALIFNMALDYIQLAKMADIIFERKNTKSQRDTFELTCHRCNQKGHIAPQCPQKNTQKTNNAFTKVIDTKQQVESEAYANKRTRTDEQDQNLQQAFQENRRLQYYNNNNNNRYQQNNREFDFMDTMQSHRISIPLLKYCEINECDRNKLIKKLQSMSQPYQQQFTMGIQNNNTNIEYAQSSLVALKVYINDKPYTAFVDEGSKFTYFSKKFYEKENFKRDRKNTLRMKTANNHISDTYGTHYCQQFKVGNHTFRNKAMQVSFSDDYDILLGKDVKNLLNIHTLFGKTYMLSLQSKDKIEISCNSTQHQRAVEDIYPHLSNLQQKYDILYVDPPWSYANTSHTFAPQYNTLSLSDLEKLPIQQLTKDNYIMLLWVTRSMQKKAQYLLEHWGFQYDIVFSTQKKQFKKSLKNISFKYTIPKTKFLYVAYKGQPSFLPSRANYNQFYESYIESHSQKPTYFQTLINNVFGVQSKNLAVLELFARQQSFYFDTYGDQLNDHTNFLPTKYKSLYTTNFFSLVQENTQEINKQFDQQFCDFLSKQQENILASNNSTDSNVPSIFKPYNDVFAKHDFDLGCVSSARHYINLQERAVPKKRNYFKIGPKQTQFLKDVLSQLLHYNIIQPLQSEWASPIVLPKKGDSFRFCIAYKELNEATKKFQYPIPIIDDLLYNLSQAKYFSKIDMKNGYWQILINELDRHKIAFTYKFGSFEWLRMPQGLCNAPATFQQLVDQLFKEYIGDFIYCYIDDVLIYFNTLEEHVQHIQLVLQKLQEAHLKLSLKKCEFFKSFIHILGHIISQGNIQPNPNKIEAIQKIVPPKTIKQLQSFLGLIGYYRKFIKNYSMIAKPLTSLIQKDIKYIWKDEQQFAFEYLKFKLTQSPILRLPDLNKQFIVQIDFLSAGIFAILFQYDNDTNLEYVVQYVSRTCTLVKANYSSYEGELLAAIYALEKFRPFILEQHFKLIIDNMALTWLCKLHKANRKIERWKVELMEYDFEVVHKKGLTHRNADALSRLPCSDTKYTQTFYITYEQQDDIPCEICQQTTPKNLFLCDYCGHGYHSQCMHVEPIQSLYFYCPSCLPLVKSLKNSDPTFDLDVISYLQYNTLPLDTSAYNKIKQQADKYYIQNNNLHKKEQQGNIIIPSYNERMPLIHDTHCNTLCHNGINKTYKFLRDKFYWPYLFQDVQKCIQLCVQCQMQNNKFQKSSGYYPLYKGTRSLQIWGLDLITNLPKFQDEEKNETLDLPTSNKGNRHIVLAIDQFSKWVEVAPIPDKSSFTIAQWFNDTICCRFGILEVVGTNQGIEFKGHFDQLLQENNISHMVTPPYYPKANGMTERMNQTLVRLLRKVLQGENSKQWDLILLEVLQAIRYTLAKGTNETPYKVLFGRPPRLPIDPITFTDIFDVDLTQFVSDFYNSQLLRDKKVQKQLDEIDQKDKRNNLQGRQEPRSDLQIGQFIMLKRLRIKKLDHKAYGPFQLISFKNKNTVQLKNLVTGHLSYNNTSNIAPLYMTTT